MADLLIDMPLVGLFIKFMIASTVLLSAVWLLEKTKLINTPDLGDLAWKLAIACSFLAVLPVADLWSSTVTIESTQTAAFIDKLNQDKPLSELATSQPQESKTRTANRALIPVTFKLDPETGLVDVVREEAPTQITSNDFIVVGENTGVEYNADPDSAANANSPSIQRTGPIRVSDLASLSENDSEGANNKNFWQSAAELRTKDLAAIGWAALALLAILALIGSYRAAVKNLGSRQRVNSEDKANQLLRDICTKADIKHVPYLSRSSQIKSPICLPRREICLPDWAFDDMPESEFKSLLAHELGHMLRRDPLMLMLLQILSRIFFFQPLFIIARNRLADIAELAADEWAAEQAADSRSVANALFTCATKIHETRQIQWGLAMAGNKSILRHRVERLMNAQSTPFKSTSNITKLVLTAGVVSLSLGLPSVQFADAMVAESAATHHPDRVAPVAAIARVPLLARVPAIARVPAVAATAPLAMTPLVAGVPLVAVTPSAIAPLVAVAAAAAHPHRNNHYLVNDRNNSGSIRWHGAGESISIKWEGDFTLSDNDETIVPLDDEGFFRIKTDDDGDKHSIKFDVDDGKITRTYWKDGKKQALGKDDEKWLKKSIKRLISTGFAAEQRVARILKKSKVKGVMKEVVGFEGDYVKRLYLTHLMDQADLSNKEIIRVVDVTAKFESDFEKRLTLTTLLVEEKPNQKVLPKILAVAKDFDSDFEKRLLVSAYVGELGLNDKTIEMVMDIAENIESDFEKRLTLSMMMTQGEISDKILARVLGTAKDIKSDFEKRLLVSQFVAGRKLDTKTTDIVIDIASEFESDFELRLLLTTALADTKLNDKNIERMFDMVVDKIDSDFELRLLLTTFADQFDKSDKAISKALDGTARMGSDFEQRLLLGALVSNGKLSDKNWFKAIDIASKIDSDHEKGLAFRQMGGEIPRNNKKVVEAFEQAFLKVSLYSSADTDQRTLVRDRANMRRDQERARRDIARGKKEQAKALSRMKREMAKSQRQLKRSQERLAREQNKSTNGALYTNKERALLHERGLLFTANRALGNKLGQMNRELAQLERRLGKTSDKIKRVELLDAQSSVQEAIERLTEQAGILSEEGVLLKERNGRVHEQAEAAREEAERLRDALEEEADSREEYLDEEHERLEELREEKIEFLEETRDLLAELEPSASYTSRTRLIEMIKQLEHQLYESSDVLVEAETDTDIDVRAEFKRDVEIDQDTRVETKRELMIEIPKELSRRFNELKNKLSKTPKGKKRDKLLQEMEALTQQIDRIATEHDRKAGLTPSGTKVLREIQADAV
ncbi:MAG: hypothetical protein COB37_04240 [Kordiimonadales bacterium]|nr:MAG: hypothetical protein COB37_04240 [Kordiimonadales bacterium]